MFHTWLLMWVISGDDSVIFQGGNSEKSFAVLKLFSPSSAARGSGLLQRTWVDILDKANCWSYFTCMCRIIYQLHCNQPALTSIPQVSESGAEYINASSLHHYIAVCLGAKLKTHESPRHETQRYEFYINMGHRLHSWLWLFLSTFE